MFLLANYLSASVERTLFYIIENFLHDTLEYN